MNITECISDGEIIGFLVVQLVAAAGMFGAGYWAAGADSRPQRGQPPSGGDDALPDPRKFKPPARKL